MGIANITPDSFSDGGRFFSGEKLDPNAALDFIEQLLADGADLVDIGAESTRPGSSEVPQEIEWQRLNPVLQRCAQKNLTQKISIDTRHEHTMLHAVQDFGVEMINNVCGIASEKTLKAMIKARSQTKYVSMHMHQTPQTMQKDPLRGNEAVRVVAKFFEKSQELLQAAGFGKENIFLDPGIGFGKDDRANLKLLSCTAIFSQKHQLMIGVSRKGFLGRLLNITQPQMRDDAAKMLELGQMFMGASIIRTHDVKKLKHIMNEWGGP